VLTGDSSIFQTVLRSPDPQSIQIDHVAFFVPFAFNTQHCIVFDPQSIKMDKKFRSLRSAGNQFTRKFGNFSTSNQCAQTDPPGPS
jgi:hypothetical protein